MLNSKVSGALDFDVRNKIKTPKDFHAIEEKQKQNDDSSKEYTQQNVIL